MFFQYKLEASLRKINEINKYYPFMLDKFLPMQLDASSLSMLYMNSLNRRGIYAYVMISLQQYFDPSLGMTSAKLSCVIGKNMTALFDWIEHPPFSPPQPTASVAVLVALWHSAGGKYRGYILLINILNQPYSVEILFFWLIISSIVFIDLENPPKLPNIIILSRIAHVKTL